jgi:hypothetical protein
LGPADRSWRNDPLRLDPRPRRLCLAVTAWRIADAYRDGHSDPYFNTYRDRDKYTYTYGYCHYHAYRNSNCFADSHGHCHGVTECYSHRYANGDSRSVIKHLNTSPGVSRR